MDVWDWQDTDDVIFRSPRGNPMNVQSTLIVLNGLENSVRTLAHPDPQTATATSQRIAEEFALGCIATLRQWLTAPPAGEDVKELVRALLRKYGRGAALLDSEELIVSEPEIRGAINSLVASAVREERVRIKDLVRDRQVTWQHATNVWDEGRPDLAFQYAERANAASDLLAAIDEETKADA